MTAQKSRWIKGKWRVTKWVGTVHVVSPGQRCTRVRWDGLLHRFADGNAQVTEDTRLPNRSGAARPPRFLSRVHRPFAID